MSGSDRFGEFFGELKPLIQQYLDTRLQLLRLQAIRVMARTAGILIWLVVCLVLAGLVILFGGLMTALWFSSLLHSYVAGFGLTAALVAFLFAVLAIFRKPLVIHPLMGLLIRKAREMDPEKDEENLF